MYPSALLRMFLCSIILAPGFTAVVFGPEVTPTPFVSSRYDRSCLTLNGCEWLSSGGQTNSTGLLTAARFF